MKTEMYCYLEDHEKKVLPETDVWNQWLDPDYTAIACIDMHRGHVGDDPELTLPAPRARDRIPAHNLFHRYAREVGVPIIHVQHWQRHGGIDDARSRSENPGANWRHLYDLYLPPNPLMLEHSWEGTKWLDIMIEEQPEDYYIRTKKRLSAFYPTDFEFLLRQLGIRNLVITGTMTAMSEADRPDLAAPAATFGFTCRARYPGSPSGCTCTPSATSPAIRSIHGFTAATSTFGSGASIGPALHCGVMKSRL